MSYRQIFYQIVFATKKRENTITESHCDELYKYIWGIVKNCQCKLYRINGTEDHIHIFSDLNASLSLADYIKKIKVGSSLWMKDHNQFKSFSGWQEGYGAFTYSLKKRMLLSGTSKIRKSIIKRKRFRMNSGGCWLKMVSNLTKNTCCEPVQPLSGLSHFFLDPRISSGAIHIEARGASQ